MCCSDKACKLDIFGAKRLAGHCFCSSGLTSKEAQFSINHLVPIRVSGTAIEKVQLVTLYNLLMVQEEEIKLELCGTKQVALEGREGDKAQRPGRSLPKEKNT